MESGTIRPIQRLKILQVKAKSIADFPTFTQALPYSVPLVANLPEPYQVNNE
ncbi:MAG: hypothetical protein RJA81_2381 [Planctomycetota bacterium]|jgi:hypothetical protein